MRQSENRVDIRGKIKEIDLVEDVERGQIRGKVTMLVEQSIEGMMETDEIVVSAFANKITKAGKENIQYTQLLNLMKNAKSIMASSESEASVYDVNGILDENTFADRSGNDVTYTFVRGSFFNETRPNFVNESYARFKQEIMIVSMEDEVDKDESLTGRLVLKGAVMNYAGPCSVTYIVESKPAIEFIGSNWNVGDTVLVQGLLRGKAELVENTKEDMSMGFGASFSQSYVKTVKENVITAGSEAYPEERAFNPQEVMEARAEKKKKYEEKKAAQASAPAATASQGTKVSTGPVHQNMGFSGINRGF